MDDLSLGSRPLSVAFPRPALLRIRSSDAGCERFFGAAASPKPCPETALLCAVLENAFVSFQNRFNVSEAKAAENWFLSDDSREVFSFLSVCMALGLDPGFIRKRLDRLRQGHVDSETPKR
jgi:hypothetical protein